MKRVGKFLIFGITFCFLIIMIYSSYNLLDFMLKKQNVSAWLDKKSIIYENDGIEGEVKILSGSNKGATKKIEFEKRDSKLLVDTLCVYVSSSHEYVYACESKRISTGKAVLKVMSVILFLFLSIITLKDALKREMNIDKE